MNNLTSCHNCWNGGDCRTCEHKSNLEIENRSAEKALDALVKIFGLFCLIVLITLI